MCACVPAGATSGADVATSDLPIATSMPERSATDHQGCIQAESMSVTKWPQQSSQNTRGVYLQHSCLALQIMVCLAFA